MARNVKLQAEQELIRRMDEVCFCYEFDKAKYCETILRVVQ
ncbi:hypothetical protein [Campylobacter troglodytis]|nr:hypothetical protein [Campylobacter troglodytis]